MKATTSKYTTIDEYIARFPEDIQKILKELRQVIKTAAPEAEESIAYMMPAFKVKDRPLVYFAANKKHIGLYPTSSVVENAIPEAAQYRTGKGTLQFPLDQPIPYGLIKKIVELRLKEDNTKSGY